MGPPRYYNLINRQAGRTLYLPPPKSSPAFLLVVMVLAFLAGHEALAKVLTGTGSNDRLIGTESEDRLKAVAGTTASGVALVTTSSEFRRTP